MSEQKVSESMSGIITHSMSCESYCGRSCDCGFERAIALVIQLEQDHAWLTAQVGELQTVIDASESTNAVNQLVMAMNKKVNDLMAEREELQKQLDARWRPIETAPKDGSTVITAERGSVYTNRWEEWMESWAWGDPPQWQPLPTPPQETNDSSF